MGAKITIDCATLMNKGLELIEAMRLYRLPMEQVSVVIHRQSVVHSPGGVCGRGGVGPTGGAGYAVAHSIGPHLAGPGPLSGARPDLLSCGPLTLTGRIWRPSCLGLCYGGSQGRGYGRCGPQWANEVAGGCIFWIRWAFYDIYDLVKQALDRVPFVKKPDLGQILAADRLAREAVYANLGG